MSQTEAWKAMLADAGVPAGVPSKLLESGYTTAASFKFQSEAVVDEFVIDCSKSGGWGD